ncbi:unnamed protein product [Rotaria socialis]
MYDGYELRLFGICFTDNSYIIEVDGQEVTNCIRTPVYMICTMPMVSEGRSSIKSFTSDRRLLGETYFLSLMPETDAELILSNGPHDKTNMFYGQTARKVDLGFGAMNLSAINNLNVNFSSIFPLVGEPRDRVHSLGISLEIVLSNTASPALAWKGAKLFLVRPLIASYSLLMRCEAEAFMLSVAKHYPEAWKTLLIYKNLFSDILPYTSCCGTGAETLSTCQNYFTHRPAGRCQHMIPLPVISDKGDPHFSTLAGKSYRFNGHGEYTLMKSIDSRLEVQVRLARVINVSASPDSVSSIDNATAIVAFVIHHKDQLRVQLELFPIYSDEHQLTIRQRDARSISISYGSSGIQFIVYLRPNFNFVDLYSILPSTLKKETNFQGLLGDFNGLVSPDGTIVSAKSDDDKELFYYDESWRTTGASSIFYHRLQDSHARYQDFNYRPIFVYSKSEYTLDSVSVSDC